MKTVGWAALMLLAGSVFVASAQEEQYAYSANAVGVIRKTLPSKKMMMVALPLDDASSTNAVVPFANLPFLTTLPNGSSINIWDVSNSAWVTATKTVGKWRGAATNESVSAGQSLFIKNGGTSSVLITLVGEVPDDPSITIPLANASQLQGCANPYPVAFEFAKSALASNAVNGSSVNFWDTDAGTSGEWVTATKTVGKWRGGAANYEVAPGEGFMMKFGATTVSGGAWTVSKPYEWPE